MKPDKIFSFFRQIEDSQSQKGFFPTAHGHDTKIKHSTKLKIQARKLVGLPITVIQSAHYLPEQHWPLQCCVNDTFLAPLISILCMCTAGLVFLSSAYKSIFCFNTVLFAEWYIAEYRINCRFGWMLHLDESVGIWDITVSRGMLNVSFPKQMWQVILNTSNRPAHGRTTFSQNKSGCIFNFGQKHLCLFTVLE